MCLYVYNVMANNVCSMWKCVVAGSVMSMVMANV
jgi:hypothetical protein